MNWCVAKSSIFDSNSQDGLDYACGIGGVNCTAIQQGGMCYNPDSVAFHASYAFDNYYKKNGMATGTCNFDGNGAVTNQDPSKLYAYMLSLLFSHCLLAHPSTTQTSRYLV